MTASRRIEFAAFCAIAVSPTGPGVAILPDVRGFSRFYEELAVRFAKIGVDPVAIDYFGRTTALSSQTPISTSGPVCRPRRRRALPLTTQWRSHCSARTTPTVP